jgi:hypothetical protein
LKDWITGWHREQWDIQNNKKAMEHSDHWIAIGWHYYEGPFPRTENVPKMSLLIFNFKIFFRRKFCVGNHILQNLLSAENFPEWKCTFRPGVMQAPPPPPLA